MAPVGSGFAKTCMLGPPASAAESAASVCPSDYAYPAPSEAQLERLRSLPAAGPGGSQPCAILSKGSLFGGSHALRGEHGPLARLLRSPGNSNSNSTQRQQLSVPMLQ